MSATLSVRTAAMQWVQQMLSAHPTMGTVPVFYGPPRDTEAQAEMVLVGLSTAGTITLPVMNSGRRQREDEFTFDVRFITAIRGRDGYTATARSEEMYGALEDVLAGNANTGGMVPGVWKVQLDHVRGPEATPNPNGDGWAADMVATVHFYSRLT